MSNAAQDDVAALAKHYPKAIVLVISAYGHYE